MAVVVTLGTVQKRPHRQKRKHIHQHVYVKVVGTMWHLVCGIYVENPQPQDMCQ